MGVEENLLPKSVFTWSPSGIPCWFVDTFGLPTAFPQKPTAHAQLATRFVSWSLTTYGHYWGFSLFG
jgi:hypothetical protein